MQFGGFAEKGLEVSNSQQEAFVAASDDVTGVSEGSNGIPHVHIWVLEHPWEAVLTPKN